jgi:hypothetical protein
MDLHNSFRRRESRLAAYAAVIVFLAAASGSQPPDRSPDYVLLNGKVFTAFPAQPFVQAVAIRGDRILATGTSAQISAMASPLPKER